MLRANSSGLLGIFCEVGDAASSCGLASPHEAQRQPARTHGIRGKPGRTLETFVVLPLSPEYSDLVTYGITTFWQVTNL